MTYSTFFIYLAIIATSTYLVRAIPFALINKKIENKFIRSFLHYIPYAVLTAMTIPAIFTAATSIIAAVLGFAVAVILALYNKKLTTVALFSCLTVYIVEMIIDIL